MSYIYFSIYIYLSKYILSFMQKIYKISKCPPFLLGKMRCKSLIRCIGLLQLHRGSGIQRAGNSLGMGIIRAKRSPGPHKL